MAAFCRAGKRSVSEKSYFEASASRNDPLAVPSAFAAKDGVERPKAYGHSHRRKQAEL